MTELNLNPTIEQATNLDDFNVGFYTGVRTAIHHIKEQAPRCADDMAAELEELQALAQSYVSPQWGEADHAFVTDTRRDISYLKLKAARGESVHDDLKRHHEKFKAYLEEHEEVAVHA